MRIMRSKISLRLKQLCLCLAGCAFLYLMQDFFLTSLNARPVATIQEESMPEAFQGQILQAVKNLKFEVDNEKENFLLIMNQIQELFDLMDGQTQKLQAFIEETKEKVKTDYPSE